MLASREVTAYVDRGREYAVILQADEEDRRTPGDLANIFLRADQTDELVPLGALVRIEERASAPSSAMPARPSSIWRLRAAFSSPSRSPF